MANKPKKPKQFFDEDPYPTVQRGVIAPGADAVISYQNGVEEASEVQRIQIDAPADVQVTLRRTEDNQDQTVEAAINVGDLETEAGHQYLNLRKVERDKPLTIRRNQSIDVILHNTYDVNVSYFVKVFKTALRFYTPLEDVKASTPTR